MIDIYREQRWLLEWERGEIETAFMFDMDVHFLTVRDEASINHVWSACGEGRNTGRPWPE